MKSNVIEIKNNELLIKHTVIASNTNNENISIRKLIDNYKNDFEEFGELSFEMTKTTNTALGNGRPSKIYYLNEQQATLLLTYLKNSEIVRRFKIKLVSEFFKMQEYIYSQSNTKKVYVNLSDSKVREAFYIAYDGKCYYSHEKLSNRNFHINHIQPTVKEFYSNLIPNLNYKKSQKIENNTTEYFIKNCVVFAKAERLSTTKLYESYLNFCMENQISPYLG